MLERMEINGLTVFTRADLKFAPNLNVIVGENGAGKTHLLKMAYTVLAVSAEQSHKTATASVSPSVLQVRLADKLVNVFRSERLGNLVRRKSSKGRCGISTQFQDHRMDIAFDFTSSSDSEVRIDKMPTAWAEKLPVYLPSRELLTLYPNFVSVYENHYLDFEETWRDTSILLGGLVQRGTQGAQIQELMKTLEDAMGGKIELDRNGRFYLSSNDGRMEIPLVAEGLRKLAMLARLIATGSLIGKGYLFWDEPEANLNPKLVRQVARSILALAQGGIQVFIATHSLFLLRELEILLASSQKGIDSHFIGLHIKSSGVSVQQGNTIDEIGDIAALDEVLRQSDRFLAEK